MMTPVTAPTTAAPPDDPVRTALADPATRDKLRIQALSRLNKWLADLPKERRNQEADEVVDLTQTRALEKSETFDPSRSDVGAWLCGVLSNVAREYCRKLRKLPVQPPQGSQDWDGAERRLRDDDFSTTSKLLERLNPDDRKLVEWSVFDELSHRQIGERLKITIVNARVRLHRVLGKLERAIQAERREGQS